MNNATQEIPEVAFGLCSCGGYGQVFDADTQRETGRCHDPMKPQESPTPAELLLDALRDLVSAVQLDDIAPSIEGRLARARYAIARATPLIGARCSTCGGVYGMTPRCPGCFND